jgi:hypothetical protein
MDKLVNVTEFGTSSAQFQNGLPELGLELDDMRGRQDTQVTQRLFPQSAGGGGQSLANYVVNRYRPGNRYKFVRLNGTVVQFDAVRSDETFVTEEQRAENVIQCPNNQTIGNVLDGVVEFGDGGPLATDPALTSHAAGVFGFITTSGKAICNVNVAVTAGQILTTGGGAVGRLQAIAVTTPTAAEVVAIANMASGKGARALVAEPPSQPSAFKANLTWIKIT